MASETPVMQGNLAVRVASDPQLMKLFTRLKDPAYHIDKEYEEMIKQLGSVRSAEKGVLVSKATSPEDLQTQLRLMSGIQHCLDRIHDINTDLYIVQNRYKELFNTGLNIITLNYFNELNELKDGVRKSVLAVALSPIQEGINRLQHLIDRGETTHKHLTATNWNIKSATDIINEFLSVFKYGSSVRVPTEI